MFDFVVSILKLAEDGFHKLSEGSLQIKVNNRQLKEVNGVVFTK